MHRGVLLVWLCVIVGACSPAAPVPAVILDHDGGIDDLVVVAMLLKSPGVRVRAITICPADSYLEPATHATEILVDRLGGRDITIAQGHSEGINPFPDEWRQDPARALTVPVLAGVKPESPTRVVGEDAAHHLVSLLSGTRRYVILETGPFTNIADALRLDPAIKDNIIRIYVMGGAVRVGGNVEQAGHDGSAEWNIFNQPEAAAEVIRSGIPITLVPLDATNKVPLTRGFLDRLRARSSFAAQFSAQSWQLVSAGEGSSQYYFWDTLTAAAMLDPSVVKTETIPIRVITTGASQGRTEEDAAGVPVSVAVDADRQKVETMFVEVLGR